MEIMILAASQLIPQLPLLVTWGVGISLSLIFWRRHPQVSLLTIAALAIFLGQTLLSSFVNIWIPLSIAREGRSPAQVGSLFAVIATV